MKKYTTPFAILFAIISTPLWAQDGLICDVETMDTVEEMVELAPEASKEIAVAEYAVAKEKMEAGDAETCAIHLNNAAKASAQ